MKVMLAVLCRALEVGAHWPAHRQIGSLMVPLLLAQKHAYREGTTQSDAGGCHRPDHHRRRWCAPAREWGPDDVSEETCQSNLIQKVRQKMINAGAPRVLILLLTVCMPQSYVARAQSDMRGGSEASLI
ncbi:MAG TPA: hypothetical protein VJ124_07665 [Pyrinomonadaceae bacterium]|nr:hypothetical protein [Pyrinomonadaceae bacterium]